MKPSSTYKILYLLNLLLKKDYTKNDLLKEFEKKGIYLNRASINSYVEKLKANGIDIETLKQKKENLYHIKKENFNLSVNEKEAEAIKDVKKLLIAQKNYNRIRKTMRLFYKFAMFIKDENIREQFIDFGYYSTINWQLVKELEKHCKTKDIILIDYILPTGKNMHLKIHVDNLKIGNWSDRLYLNGVLDRDIKLSHLPVDRIYMIKKTIKQNARFNLKADILTYKITKEIYNQTETDSKERLISLDKNFAHIQRPIEDKFYLVQRLLHFCPDLYYVSDKNIKNMLNEKLEMMKASYDNKIDE